MRTLIGEKKRRRSDSNDADRLNSSSTICVKDSHLMLAGNQYSLC